METQQHHQLRDSGVPPASQNTDEEDDDPELAEKMRLYPEDFLPTKPQLGTFGFAWARGVVSPFISSKEDKMEAIFMAVGHLLTESAVVMDVGCGDGAFLLQAASRFGCQCYGLEIDAALAELAREKAKERKVWHLTRIFDEDLFDAFGGLRAEEEDVSVEKGEGSGSESLRDVAAAVRESTVFYFYLLPAVLDKLEPCLLSHMASAAPGHLTYIFNTWAPASPELEARFLAPPCERATQSKRGFFVFQS
jgi:SAM-dependent methyltransferase